MKLNITFILLILYAFLVNESCMLATPLVSSVDNQVLYQYNLLDANTYSGKSTFSASTKIYELWDIGTSSGVNDNNATGETEAWIEFDFGQEEDIAEAKLWEDNGGNQVTHWKVMYWNKDSWEDIFPYESSSTSGWQSKTFDITTSKVRFYAKCISGGCVSIHEMALLTKPSLVRNKTVIGCVGDSNTAGGVESNTGFYTWPVLLSKILGYKHQVRNFGRYGTTLLSTGNDPWANTKPSTEAGSQYNRHKEQNPDISIIALGTNDSKEINWTTDAPTRFRNEYVAMIQEFQSYPAKPKVIMFMPIRAFSTTSSIRNSVIDTEIRPIIRDISKTYGIALIDGYAASENMSEMMPDGIHPDEAGLRILADKIASIIQARKPIITLGGQPTTTNYAEYRWYKNDVLISGASASSYTATEPGKYKVAVRLNQNTDDIIVSVAIEVLEPCVNLVVSNEETPNALRDKMVSQTKISNYANTLLIENAADSEFFLYDLYGRILNKTTIRATYETISLANLHSGVYLYKIGSSNGKIFK